jgi:hypothetical protein
MKMRTVRRLQAQAPMHRRRALGRARRDFDFSDHGADPYPEPPPEAVFDRLTGPFGSRHDEET